MKPVSCHVPGCDRFWSRDPVLEVACPSCRSPIGSPCKRPSGWRAPSPHADRDLLADQLGHYGPCPFGKCSAAPDYLAPLPWPKPERRLRFATEPTDQGNQFVIPGCEHDQTRGPEQMDLFK